MKDGLTFRSCEKATFFIEKKVMKEITLKESIVMYGHLFICKACRRYYKQAPLIHDKISQVISNELNDEKTENLKRRIHRSIEHLEG